MISRVLVALGLMEKEAERWHPLWLMGPVVVWLGLVICVPMPLAVAFLLVTPMSLRTIFAPFGPRADAGADASVCDCMTDGAQCILPEPCRGTLMVHGCASDGALAEGLDDEQCGAGGVLARPAQEEVLDDVEQCGAGGVLARPAQEELGVAAFSSGGADSLRGGAGGSSATRRKRTEKMLASLTELLKGWADSEGETAEETATEDDGSYDVLFTQLEQLIWQRPADPVGALAALLQEWQAPPRTVQVAPRWASRRRSSDD